jgi:hypothetical protein
MHHGENGAGDAGRGWPPACRTEFRSRTDVDEAVSARSRIQKASLTLAAAARSGSRFRAAGPRPWRRSVMSRATATSKVLVAGREGAQTDFHRKADALLALVQGLDYFNRVLSGQHLVELLTQHGFVVLGLDVMGPQPQQFLPAVAQAGAGVSLASRKRIATGSIRKIASGELSSATRKRSASRSMARRAVRSRTTASTAGRSSKPKT